MIWIVVARREPATRLSKRPPAMRVVDVHDHCYPPGSVGAPRAGERAKAASFGGDATTLRGLA
jgi:hypothetical protein